MKVGPRNLITDVEGILVGNAQDDQLKSGTTVLFGETPFIAAVDIMGGSPGTRETDLLSPDKFVQEADALVLSGGMRRITKYGSRLPYRRPVRADRSGRHLE